MSIGAQSEEVERKRREEEKNEVTAKTLHERAERASLEAQKTLLSLSSGAVGVFFLSITGQPNPPLNHLEKVFVVGGTLTFGVCVLSGIVRWKTDAQRSYYEAKSRRAKNKDTKQKFSELSQRRHQLHRQASNLQPVLFGLGIAMAACYTVLRAT